MTDPVNQDEKIIRALMSAVEKHGWADLTLDHIARAAHLSPSGLRARVGDKNDLLGLLASYLDDQSQRRAADDMDPNDPVHDRLFGVFMARFDVLQDHRAGMTAILQGVAADPCALAAAVRPLAHSLSEMLKSAGVKEDSLSWNLKLIGITGIYISLLKVWLSDESEDLHRVMAALDARLQAAEKLAGLMGI